ncbi:MAG: hypothetical protein FJW96_04450 [Actinobacteria bacterium]|nr:hypothetical protein [Actinomycetota bacterium]
MADNVDRSLLEHWEVLRIENSEERRFLRLIDAELRTSGSSAITFAESERRARSHLRARRATIRLAPVIPLRVAD